MTVADRFPDEPLETREAIMLATYRALCEHGYADLTIDRIDSEFPKSKSLLYHHYDSKDDLLVDFLEYLLTILPENLAPADVDGPRARLDAIIAYVLDSNPERPDDDFHGAVMELRAQAVNDVDYREHFTRSDAGFQARIETLLRDGFAGGVFQEHDTTAAAAFIHTILLGAIEKRVTSDDPDLDAVRGELESYLDAVVYATD
jgi:AcrR family transcriptional regulator